MEPQISLACSRQRATGHSLKPDKSNPQPYTLFLSRSILILLSRLHLGLLSRLFPSGIPTILCIPEPPPPPAFYILRPFHPPWFDHSNTILRWVQILKFLIIQRFYQYSIKTVSYYWLISFTCSLQQPDFPPDRHCELETPREVDQNKTSSSC